MDLTNKTKPMKHISYLTIILLFINCDRHDTKLVLSNKTNDTIYFNIMHSDDRLEWSPLVKKNGKIDITMSQFIRPKEIKSRAIMGKWEYLINDECKDSAIRIYFFKKELVENVPKDSFLSRQAYSKKFKLKVKDLERMKWRVVYDGR